MRLHPLSIPLRAVSRVDLFELLIVAGIGYTNGGNAKILGALAGILTLVVVYGLIETARYLRFEYTLTADTLDVASGILSRRERNVPVGRVQTLDISQDVLARLGGLAAVDIETAGGGETEVTLRYVSDDEASRLQNELQRLKRDGASDSDTTEVPKRESAVTDEREPSRGAAQTESVLFELSRRDLVVLSLVRLNLRALVPITVGIVGGAQLLPEVLGPLVATPLTGALLVGVGTVLAGPVETFVRYYDFRLIDAGDELRYERGLIQRYSGSIPTEKIQTLLVHENVLERRLGYAGLDTITAGYAVSSVTDGTPSAIPLAGRDSVWQFARTVDGFDFEDVSFTLPPKRARRRYMGRYTLLVGTVTGVAAALDMFAGASVTIFEYQFAIPVLPGLDYWFILLGLLALVPLAAHLKWRNRGYAVTESHILTRNGFWNRGVQIVPYYRLQTAIHRRSLFQRRLGLSTVVVDTAGTGPLSLIGGSARAVDIGTEEAQELRETIRERFGTSLSARRRTTGEQAAST